MGAELANPATGAVEVTPSDTADLATPARALYVGGAGNISLKTVGNSQTTVLFTAVPAGTVLPVRASRIMSTNTTATAIVALW